MEMILLFFVKKTTKTDIQNSKKQVNTKKGKSWNSCSLSSENAKTQVRHDEHEEH